MYDKDYDIPDDPRPEIKHKEIDPLLELHVDIDYKEFMLDNMIRMLEKAKRIHKKQNDYWDSYGDNYKLDEVKDFVLRNKHDIIGIMGSKVKWLETADPKNWEYDFDIYYNILLKLTTQIPPVITSYKRSIRKLENKLKEMRNESDGSKY